MGWDGIGWDERGGEAREVAGECWGRDLVEK
jgi:hypothetical protein